MGVLYSVLPLDASITPYLREVGTVVPEGGQESRNPTPLEVRAVCETLTDLKVTACSPPSHHWHIMIEGLKDPEKEPWTLLHLDNFNGDETVPHSIWFEKGWPSLILRIVHGLSAKCGPLVIIPDTGCTPIVVSGGDDVSILLAMWEHTRGIEPG
jgi:hypothetical protein